MVRFTDRTKAACVPCRERKRKCNGMKPCYTCMGSKHRCYYTVKASNPTASRVEIEVKPTSPDNKQPRNSVSSKANSAFVFMTQLVQNMDSKSAPQLQPTAWNIGSRFTPDAYEPNMAYRITDLLTHTQMLTLTDAYFEKIDPCYGFLDRDAIFQKVATRWTSLQSQSTSDALLCGIAALGSYFSMGVAVSVEPQLVQLAKSILETVNPSHAVDSDILNAWVCRVIYLRCTSVPLSAWLASCTAMHLLEAAALHLPKSSDESTFVTAAPRVIPSSLRRAFGVAHHLNIWISYELGVSRVSTVQPLMLPDTPVPGNYTGQLLSLLPASLNLDPNQEQNDDALLSALSDLVCKQDLQPPLIMAQCNLILCILRRLCNHRSIQRNDDTLSNSALRFLSKSLAAARQMVEEDLPWHHLAHVPFQTLCVLIAINTQASLQMVSDAVQTIQKVAAAYNTVTMTDAYNTMCLILCLCHKRRLEDAQLIGDVLTKYIRPAQNTPALSYDDGSVTTFPETEGEWFSNLMAEYQNLPDLNLDAMLTTYPQEMLDAVAPVGSLL